MRISRSWLRRKFAFGFTMLLVIQLAETAVASPQQTLTAQQAQSLSASQNQSRDSGSRTGKTEAGSSQSDATYPDNPVPSRTQAAETSEQSSTSLSGTEQQQSGDQRPVGSAAAPYEKITGIAASRPAGAVIAPAKQRRARSIVIRVSIAVGAAVAIGTVVALTHGSPSRPN